MSRAQGFKTALSSALRNEALKSSPFSNHWFTESPQIDASEIGKL
jgi:hypothetical protein